MIAATVTGWSSGGLLAGLGAVAAVGLALAKPIRQDLRYHHFADQRRLLGTPHALNVWSNAPFVVVGVMGLAWLTGQAVPQSWLWALFFLGVTLTGFGSGYYHWRPGNATLVWDRLPMTIAFMPLFAALIAERVNERAGIVLFGPLFALGIGSVIYWKFTDDLRPYAWVQFFPLLAIPLLALLWPARYLATADILIVIAWYALAKVVEWADAPLLRWTGISGHSWKHIAAAGGAAWVLVALARA